MSKILKKKDITTLVESTLKQAGIPLKEEEIESNIIIDEEDEEVEIKVGDKKIEVEDDKEEVDEAKTGNLKNQTHYDSGEPYEEGVDPVTESVNRLAEQATKKTVISENLQKEIDSFNKMINYKY